MNDSDLRIGLPSDRGQDHLPNVRSCGQSRSCCDRFDFGLFFGCYIHLQYGIALFDHSGFSPSLHAWHIAKRNVNMTSRQYLLDILLILKIMSSNSRQTAPVLKHSRRSNQFVS